MMYSFTMLGVPTEDFIMMMNDVISKRSRETWLCVQYESTEDGSDVDISFSIREGYRGRIESLKDLAELMGELAAFMTPS